LKTVLKQIHVFIFFTFIFYLFLSCNLVEEEAPLFDNPLNPDDPEFIPPETFIIDGPAEGETITESSAAFTIGGNEGVTEYCYSKDGYATWSLWSPETNLIFENLNEETYDFEFKARYHDQAEDETPAYRSFRVDAVKGPALMFNPRGFASETNQSFTIDLVAEEVSDLNAVYAEIQYSNSYLKLDGWNVTSGDILESNGGTIADIIEHDAAAGIIKVNLVTIGAGAGANGTGSLVQLEFTALSNTGNSNLILKNTSRLIGSDLDQQTINELVNCRIEVGSTEYE